MFLLIEVNESEATLYPLTHYPCSYLQANLTRPNLGKYLLELTWIHIIRHIAYEQTHSRFI